MKMIRIIERSAWERETWNYWFDEDWYEEHRIALLDQLKLRFETIKIQKCALGGRDSYKLDLMTFEHDEIDFNSDTNSYSARNQYVGKFFSPTLLKQLLEMNDSDFLKYIYKGGIKKIFRR